MPPGLVHQRIFVDPAHTGCVGAKRGGGTRRQATLHLAQIFQHPAARPIKVGAIVEQHIDKAVAHERIATHHPRAGNREHCRGERVSDLILDNLRRLSRICCADDDLHIGEIGQGIHRRRAGCTDADDGQHNRRDHDQPARFYRPADDGFDHLAPPSARTAMPVRLASESSRNCPDATTFSPTASPSNISVCPPPSRPARTSAG